MTDCGLSVAYYPRFESEKPNASSLMPRHTFTAKFQRIRFSHIGSLFFKEDVSEELQSFPLFSENKDSHIAQFSERYCIGPLIDRQWWRGERARLDLDRGPWPNTGLTQQLILLRQPRTNRRFSITLTSPPIGIVDIPCTTAVHSRLLVMYLAAIPFIMPPNDSDICAPTLWHPDLS